MMGLEPTNPLGHNQVLYQLSYIRRRKAVYTLP